MVTEVGHDHDHSVVNHKVRGVDWDLLARRRKSRVIIRNHKRDSHVYTAGTQGIRMYTVYGLDLYEVLDLRNFTYKYIYI